MAKLHDFFHTIDFFRTFRKKSSGHEPSKQEKNYFL